MHSRRAPRSHSFRYRVWWMLVDLDELPELQRTVRVFAHNRFNLISFYDADYGQGDGPLRPYIENRLASAGLEHAAARIQLLTMPRLLGYTFNPLSIFFCYDRTDRLATVIYEVHNTFGERHSYVIGAAEDTTGIVQQNAEKAFYVSPFMDMAQDYAFRVSGPAENVAIAITASERGAPIIHTAMHGSRLPLSSATLLRLCFSHPMLTLKVIGAIHWEAFRIWSKGIGIRPRPPNGRHAATLGYPAPPAQGKHG